MMIHGQTLRKIKLLIAATAKTMRRSRIARSVLAGISASSRSFGRVLHQLWLEVTGFIFLAIAGVGAMACVREYGKYQANHAGSSGRLLLAVCFTGSFAWFGVTSFWRVSRKKLKTLKTKS